MLSIGAGGSAVALIPLNGKGLAPSVQQLTPVTDALHDRPDLTSNVAFVNRVVRESQLNSRWQSASIEAAQNLFVPGVDSLVDAFALTSPLHGVGELATPAGGGSVALHQASGDVQVAQQAPVQRSEASEPALVRLLNPEVAKHSASSEGKKAPARAAASLHAQLRRMALDRHQGERPLSRAPRA